MLQDTFLYSTLHYRYVDNSFEVAKEQKAAQGKTARSATGLMLQSLLALRHQTGGYITLECGIATIPLPGIDVPFHSRYLWTGMLPFRACACPVSCCFSLLSDA